MRNYCATMRRNISSSKLLRNEWNSSGRVGDVKIKNGKWKLINLRARQLCEKIVSPRFYYIEDCKSNVTKLRRIKLKILKSCYNMYIYICVCVKRDLRSWKCLRNFNSQTNS